MPLPTNGVISFGDFLTEFDGSGITSPISFGQMYRNTGPYVEDLIIQDGTNTVVTVGPWDPLDQYYSIGPLTSGGTSYYWAISFDSNGNAQNSGSNIVWNGTVIAQSTGASIVVSGFQYDRGPEYDNTFSGAGVSYTAYYGVRRRTFTGTQVPNFVNVNQNVPESGRIRMLLMYGAQDAD